MMSDETTNPTDGDTVAVAVLEAECDLLEKRVRLDKLARPEDVDAFRPGGSRNPDRDALSWVRYYGSLRAWAHPGGPSEELRKAPVLTAAERAAHESEIMAALGDQPETVLLVEAPLAGDGQPHFVTVHPKGFEAVSYLACVDRRIEYLCEQRAKYETAPDDSDLLERITAEVIWLYRLILWAVATPGAFLPFEPFALDGADVPEWTAAVHPIDLARIHAAFLRVQAVRMASLKLLLSAKKDGATHERPSWVTLFAALEDVKHVPTHTLMRDHTLPRLMAQAVIAADQKARALEEAREEAEKVA